MLYSCSVKRDCFYASFLCIIVVDIEKAFHGLVLLQFAEREVLAVPRFWPEEYFWPYAHCVGYI